MNTAFFDSDGSVRNGWKILGFMALLYFCYQVMGVFKLWQLLGGEWGTAFAVLMATLICLRMEGEPLPRLKAKPALRWSIEFGAGALGGLVLMLLIAGCVFALHGFHWQRNGAAGWKDLLAGTWLYLAVGVNEELLYRGYPFQRLTRGTGAWVSLALMSLWFAYDHWDNPGMAGSTRAWAMLNIFLAGILLGIGYLKTRRLALPMGLHLGWNWAQGSLLGFGVSGTMDAHGWMNPIFEGRPEWLTGGPFGLEASLPCAVLCIVAIVGLSFWKPSPKSRGSEA